MAFLSEAAIEEAVLEQLAGLGYTVENEERIGPDALFRERDSYVDVILEKRLLDAVAKINPTIPHAALDEVVKQVRPCETICPLAISLANLFILSRVMPFQLLEMKFIYKY
jgi:type I restriction enzyme R subunit